MLRRHNRAKNAPPQQKTFAGLSSSSKTKKHNRRIHHIHHLPSSQILKQRTPTTMNRFYKKKTLQHQHISKNSNQWDTKQPPNNIWVYQHRIEYNKLTIIISCTSSLQEEDSSNCPPHHKPPNPNQQPCQCKSEKSSFPFSIRDDGTRYPPCQRRIHTILPDYI